jgi:hypothetical protein
MVSLSLMNVTGHKSDSVFLCEKILANGSMKPAKLKEHLMSVHPENASKYGLCVCVRARVRACVCV